MITTPRFILILLRLSPYLLFLLSCNSAHNNKEKQNKDSALVFNIPPPPAERVDPLDLITTMEGENDPLFLVLTLSKTNYQISFLNDTLITSDIKLLDDFLLKKKSKLNPEKILVDGDPKLKYQEYLPVMKVLKQYGFFKFKATTREN